MNESNVDALEEIRRVFQLEIDTLLHVRDLLQESYARAADLLYGCKGKVVVSTSCRGTRPARS